ncbi:unnamed protein product, partial [Ectocarpus sp. 12 AP-2014]
MVDNVSRCSCCPNRAGIVPYMVAKHIYARETGLAGTWMQTRHRFVSIYMRAKRCLKGVGGNMDAD